MATRSSSIPGSADKERCSLSGLQNRMLLSLYQHRLLSTTQLLALHAPGKSRRWVQRQLAELEAAGYVARVSGRPPTPEALWFVSEVGAEASEGEGVDLGVPARAYRMTPDKAAGPLQAHTLAVNEVGIAFVDAARQRDHECDPLAWQHEVVHPFRERDGRCDVLIADALLHYTAYEEGECIVLARFIELDRGTMPVAALEAKLHQYAQLYHFEPRSPGGRRSGGRSGDHPRAGWAMHYASFPKVLVVLCDQPQSVLKRRIHTLMDLYSPDPARAETQALGVCLTTLEALRRAGPFAPIFWCPSAPEGPVDLLGRRGERRARPRR
jgi:hypothetical protein